jgi:hypothetical protein
VDDGLELGEGIRQWAQKAPVEEEQIAEHVVADQNRSVLLKPILHFVCQLLDPERRLLDYLHQRMESVWFKFFQASTHKSFCDPPEPHMLPDSFLFDLQFRFEGILLIARVPKFDLDER